MSFPRVVYREDRLGARKKLLAEEEYVRWARDASRAERQALPMAEVDEEYTFEDPVGEASTSRRRADRGPAPLRGPRSSAHDGLRFGTG
jgi:predicted dithiol-disulfide oxidoreductase (DUF899 family)